jgi:phage baseplate assembly protein W
MSDATPAGAVSRGLAWPMRIDERGSFDFDVGVADIVRSIGAILATAQGERLMRPDFGCRLWAQMSRPIDAAAITRLTDSVQEAVTRWEPRIEVRHVAVAEVPLNDDLDSTSVVSPATGERVDGIAIDVDIDFVERATTEPATVGFRCLQTTDWILLVHHDRPDVEPDPWRSRILLRRVKGAR